MQYLPHIMQEVVATVSAKMEDRKPDPFEVFFEYGLYQDVFRTVHSRKDKGFDVYPLVWLTMPFNEAEGTRSNVAADVSCDLIIAMVTQPDWTMQEREERNFFPRIFPIYDELINQLSKNGKLISNGLISRTKRILPYWGGDESNNNNPNLSRYFVDAIQIKDLKISIRKTNC